MKQNNLHKNKEKGQILIIFLLVLVVGLAIVLSVASRSITDIRTTTTSDESNRAYFAAEAGIEEALKRLETPAGFTDATLNFTNVNQTTAKVKANPLEIDTSAGQAYAFQSDVAKDDVVQVSLLIDFNDPDGDLLADPADNSPYPQAIGGGALEIFWGNGSGDLPAIEVTVVYCNDPCNPPIAFGLKKFAFDPDVPRRSGVSGNQFCNAPTSIPASDTSTNRGDIRFSYSQLLDIRANLNCGDAGTTVEGISTGTTPVLVRIKPLYNSESQPIGVRAS